MGEPCGSRLAGLLTGLLEEGNDLMPCLAARIQRATGQAFGPFAC